MIGFYIGNVALMTVLDTRREKAKTGLYPIRYRVTYARKQVYYYSGYDMSEEDWNKIESSTTKNLTELRGFIKLGADRIEKEVRDILKEDVFSFSALNSKLGKGNNKYVFLAYETKVDKLKTAMKYSTAEWYYYSMQSIKKFTTKNLEYKDITSEWLIKYVAWLKENKKSITTISMHLRALQSIYNGADLPKGRSPFGADKFKIPKGRGRKLALNLTQIKDVLDYPLTSDTAQMCRDIWYFSYLGSGININDLVRLKGGNISGNRIFFVREKTKDTNEEETIIRLVFLQPMKDIIIRWGNINAKKDEYLFKFLTPDMSPLQERTAIRNLTRLMNKKMKDIGDSLGIGSISTYVARHSYSTILKNSGTPIEFISEQLGHSDTATTKKYLAGFEDSQIDEIAHKVIPQ